MNIKKRVFSLLSSCYVVGCLLAQNILISTPATSLVLSAPEKGELKYIYYGAKLSDRDFQTIGSLDKGKYAAYPVYGLNCPSEVALAVKHNDGNMTLQLEVVKVESSHQDEVNLTIISLKDKVYPFYVKMYYKAYQDTDIIEIWSEISHQEKKTVVLNQFASAYLPIRKGDVWLSHLYGAWANEGRLEEVPLDAGMKVIKNKDGVRNSHTAHAEVMFSLDGKPRENEGRVIGAALCYSGNYKLRIDTDESDYHHFFAGINEDNSTYNLKNGEVFRTPEQALTYSDEGLSGSSRSFHRWARLHKLANGTKLRKILLNSWEGVYLKINEDGMNQMMADIASMGGELFVMDDGWFGDKYPRRTDKTSLGDWVVDRKKLPSGIGGLLENARKNGVKFGIWIEPEMANTTSELYEKHPDWILKAPNRELVLGRGGTQVVLDLANPKVQDFIFGMVDNLMTNYPEIDYIKWDANMSIMNHGSNYLSDNDQSHMY
ncbi:family 10 glycosylhydrolase, partial [Bacteroides ovatus]